MTSVTHMSAPKYLRYIRNRWDEVPFLDFFRAAEVHHITYLLQMSFAPVPSPGIAMINVTFIPSGVPSIQELIDIADLRWPFAVDKFQELSVHEQQVMFIQKLRDALMFAADRYGLDKGRLDASCEKVQSDGFKAQWWWPAKPKFDPTRRTSARVFVEVAHWTRIWVAFFDRAGVKLNRALVASLGHGDTGGALESVLGDLRWEDADTLRLVCNNKRDYWRISLSGAVQFVFPMAQPNNPQGLYQLGRMFWEGRLVATDRVKAIELMRQSAALGYKHAERFVENFGKRIEP